MEGTVSATIKSQPILSTKRKGNPTELFKSLGTPLYEIPLRYVINVALSQKQRMLGTGLILRYSAYGNFKIKG